MSNIDDDGGGDAEFVSRQGADDACDVLNKHQNYRTNLKGNNLEAIHHARKGESVRCNVTDTLLFF